MASIFLKIRPRRPNSLGRFPIFVAISHNKETRYVPTPFDVAAPSHFDGGRILTRGASETNKHLAFILDEFRGKLARLDLSRFTTCSQLKDALTAAPQTKQPLTISKMFSSRADLMESEGRLSYADMLRYSARVIVPIIGDLAVNSITRQDIRKLLDEMRAQGFAPGNIQMRLTHFKSCINRLIDEDQIRYDVHPFRGIKIPQSKPKYTDITRDEFVKIRDLQPDNKRLELGRNLWLLSFYLCGLNLADLTRLGEELREPVLKFERQKTKDHKRGSGITSFSIPNEARELIDWAETYGVFKLKTPTEYKNLQRYANRCMSLLAERVGISGSFSYYSARHTWAQFAFLCGVPTEIVGFCLGHSVSTNGRAIYNYIRVMQSQADRAIADVLDYVNHPDHFDL